MRYVVHVLFVPNGKASHLAGIGGEAAMSKRREIGVLPRRRRSRQKKLIHVTARDVVHMDLFIGSSGKGNRAVGGIRQRAFGFLRQIGGRPFRSEEHTSELQS